MGRRTPEVYGEITNRLEVSEPGKPAWERFICCTDCRRGFLVQAPPYATKLRLAAYLNKRFPACPGHPVFLKSGTLEIFPHELPPEKSPEAIDLENNFRRRKPQRFGPETVSRRAGKKEKSLEKAREGEELYSKGFSYLQIAEELGYRSSKAAYFSVWRLKQSRLETK